MSRHSVAEAFGKLALPNVSHVRVVVRPLDGEDETYSVAGPKERAVAVVLEAWRAQMRAGDPRCQRGFDVLVSRKVVERVRRGHESGARLQASDA